MPLTLSSLPSQSFQGLIIRALTKAPLWPLLLGSLLGILQCDSSGWSLWTKWSYFAVFSGAALITLFVRQLPHWPHWHGLPHLLLGSLLGFILGFSTHYLTLHQQTQWADTFSDPHGTSVTLNATVIDCGPHATGPYLIRVTSCQSHVLPSGVHLVLNDFRYPRTTIPYGEKISVSGTLAPIGPLRNPHGFDQKAWRHRQGADLSLTTFQPIQTQGLSPRHVPVRQLTEWRQSIRHKITSGLAPDSTEAQLIRAVVLGERPPRQSEMINDFRHSGTLHVFAVSGLHVGMVGSIIALVFWFSRVPRWATILLTILGMILYAGITGLRPPAVRAVIMASVYLSGFLLQRRPSLINSLAVSAIIVLLWDGHQLFTAGFQLTYGVLFSIAILSGLWSTLFKPIASLDPFMPRLLLSPQQERWLTWREKLQGALAVSTSAWFGSSPLMWFHFGIITPVSIIASLPLILMVFLILSLAMFSLPLGALWSPAGAKINQLNAAIARATHGCATTFARLPSGHLKRHPQLPTHGRIIVFDLPNGGGASLLQLGGSILLDSGRPNHFRYHVQPTLSYLQTQPDSLIISHADANHSGAMPVCLSTYQPKQAIIPRKDQRSPSFLRFLENAKTSGCNLITPHQGQLFPLNASDPSAFLEIIHAPVELDGHGRADDSGLVILLHWRGWRILFTGDAGWTTESRLLESGMDLKADVIVMGRHREDFTGRLPFIDAVSPKAIISSHWHFPRSERIPTAWKKEIHARNITLFDQHLTGAVTITIQDKQLVLSPMLPSASPLTLDH